LLYSVVLSLSDVFKVNKDGFILFRNSGTRQSDFAQRGRLEY
jgi:hypothetical protein